MNVEDTKMSKSKGNFLKLSDIEDGGISPLAFRYWLLTSHYRTQVNVTLEALQGAQNAYIRLVETFMRLQEVEHEHVHAVANPRNYEQEFEERISDDFDMPGAVALTWDMIKDHSLESRPKVDLLLKFDKVFGLGLHAVHALQNEEVPAEVLALAEAREEARKAKEWEKADALRKELLSRGYEVLDEKDGFRLREV